ncbi:MAG: hypothetical protein GWP05_07960 [Anaerolineaceae bacterium]|nr:hypothetical protein [Anaerolineaceae bacterium]
MIAQQNGSRVGLVNRPDGPEGEKVESSKGGMVHACVAMMSYRPDNVGTLRRSMGTGKQEPVVQARQLDHRQSPGRSTNPRRTGFAWM